MSENSSDLEYILLDGLKSLFRRGNADELKAYLRPVDPDLVGKSFVWAQALKLASEPGVRTGLLHTLVAYGLDHGFDLNATDAMGRTAAHYASAQALEVLAEYGANLDKPCEYTGLTPLNLRCVRAVGNVADAEEMRFLVARGVNLETSSHQGLTPLLNLVRSQDFHVDRKHELVEILVEGGADIHAVYGANEGVLSLCDPIQTSSRTPLYLIDKGVVASDRELLMAARICIRQNDGGSLQALMEKGLPKLLQDEQIQLEAYEVLRLACVAQSPAGLMVMLENGWDPDQVALHCHKRNRLSARQYLNNEAIENPGDTGNQQMLAVLTAWDARLVAKDVLAELMAPAP